MITLLYCLHFSLIRLIRFHWKISTRLEIALVFTFLVLCFYYSYKYLCFLLKGVRLRFPGSARRTTTWSRQWGNFRWKCWIIFLVSIAKIFWVSAMIQVSNMNFNIYFCGIRLNLISEKELKFQKLFLSFIADEVRSKRGAIRRRIGRAPRFGNNLRVS